MENNFGSSPVHISLTGFPLFALVYGQQLSVFILPLDLVLALFLCFVFPARRRWLKVLSKRMAHYICARRKGSHKVVGRVVFLGWWEESHITVKPDNNFALWPRFMPTRHTIISPNRLGARKLSKHLHRVGVPGVWWFGDWRLRHLEILTLTFHGHWVHFVPHYACRK